MNQLAWSKQQEEDGILFKWDPLALLGVDENLYDYINKI